MIRFKCGECQTVLQAAKEHAGRRFKCPKCSSVVTVAKPEAKKPAPYVFCICSSCKANFNAKETATAKSIPCPKCGEMFSLPGINELTSDNTAVRFICSACKQKYAVPEKYAGKKFGCVKCKNPCVIPAIPQPQPEPQLELEDNPETESELIEQQPEDEFEEMDAENFDWDKVNQYIEEHKPETDLTLKEPEENDKPEPEVYDDPFRRIKPSSGPSKQYKEPSAGSKLVVPVAVIGFYVLLFAGLFVVRGGPPEDKSGAAIGHSKKTIKHILAGDIGGPSGLGDLIELVDTGSFDGQMDYTPVAAALIAGAEITNTESNVEFAAPAYGISGYIVKSIVTFDTGIKREVLVASTVQRDTFSDVQVIVNDENGNQLAALTDAGLDEIRTLFTATAATNNAFSTSQFVYALAAICIVGFLMTVSIWRVLEMAGQPGWACIVPFYSTMCLAQAGDRSSLIGLACALTAGIPFIGGIISLILLIYITIGIAQTFNRGILFGVGLGLLPLIFFPILAFSENSFN